MAGHLLILFISVHLVVEGQGSKPEVSVVVHTDIVGIICSLFGSAKSSTTCHLYYGESLQPILTKTVEENMKDNRRFCHFFISLDDLQRHIYTLKTKEISCDYSLENGDKSRRSDGYNMSAFIKDPPVPQPHVTTTVLEPVKTTNPGHMTGSETKASSPDLDDMSSSITVTTETSLTTVLCAAFPSSRTLVWAVITLLLRAVMAVILLTALSFCCVKILIKWDGKCSRGQLETGDRNSEDPNNGALVLSEVNTAAASIYCLPESQTVNREELGHVTDEVYDDVLMEPV